MGRDVTLRWRSWVRMDGGAFGLLGFLTALGLAPHVSGYVAVGPLAHTVGSTASSTPSAVSR